MVKFTNQQRLEIIKSYYRNSESVVATLRALTPILGRNNRPTRQAVRAIVDKFESTFSLLDVPVPKRRRTARSEENIAAVSALIQNEPKQSILRRSQELVIAQFDLIANIGSGVGAGAAAPAAEAKKEKKRKEEEPEESDDDMGFGLFD